MGPNPTQHKGKANVGSLFEQKPEEEAGQSQAPPLHLISSELYLGKGPGQIIGALTWLLPFTVHFPE